MSWCRTCDNFMLYPDSHRCPPHFLCEEVDGCADPIRVYANDAESAAEKFCEQLDSGGDYDIIRCGEAKVIVTDPLTDEVTRWNIVAESVPHYTAYAAEGGDA